MHWAYERVRFQHEAVIIRVRTTFGSAFHIQKRAHTCRRLAGFAYLCDDAGRVSPRAGRRADPRQVPSRQTLTVADKASKKDPPRVEKRVAKKGERSGFHFFNSTILDLLHIFIQLTTFRSER